MFAELCCCHACDWAEQGFKEAGIERWRSEAGGRRRGGGKREGEIDADERNAVTDSGERWRGMCGEMEARREKEAGNPAGVPSKSAFSAASSQPQPGE